jgi:hypothetical protein
VRRPPASPELVGPWARKTRLVPTQLPLVPFRRLEAGVGISDDVDLSFVAYLLEG